MFLFFNLNFKLSPRHIFENSSLYKSNFCHVFSFHEIFFISTFISAYFSTSIKGIVNEIKVILQAYFIRINDRALRPRNFHVRSKGARKNTYLIINI